VIHKFNSRPSFTCFVRTLLLATPQLNLCGAALSCSVCLFCAAFQASEDTHHIVFAYATSSEPPGLYIHGNLELLGGDSAFTPSSGRRMGLRDGMFSDENASRYRRRPSHGLCLQFLSTSGW